MKKVGLAMFFMISLTLLPGCAAETTNLNAASPDLRIDSFTTCMEAGNPITESHPRQCMTADGDIYVEEISEAPMQTKHLAFQMFTGGPDPSVPIGISEQDPLSPPPSKEVMSQFVEELIAKIGTTGEAHTKLAFVLGPLAFDHTDAQLRQMITDAFAIALEQDIAVGFHIDDSMFWARRTDLWEDPANVEWLGWEGTPNTGRRIQWGPEPIRFPPQMCFNSAAIQAAVQHLATDVIGSSIRDGVAMLDEQGKGHLFAGVIVGWETQIGRDFETGQYLGFCALTNRGFSAGEPPEDLDREREAIVQEFIELWAISIAAAEVSPGKIYSHTAAVSTQTYETMPADETRSYSQLNYFAPPEVSFSEHYNPGFSTYPQVGLMPQLYEALEQNGNPPWASSEGTNIQLATLQNGGSMETYLAWMFDHGAILVNIFGWGVGPESIQNPFREVTEAPDALDAYRKFLRGDMLIEGDYVFFDLPNKIQIIQTELPVWLQQHPNRQADVERLIGELDQHLSLNQLQEASEVADEILSMINQ